MSNTLNKAQQVSLKRVYDRKPILKDGKPLTYRQFRRTAYQSHMGCVMVPWQGMWLGIEPDGYTHS